MIRLYLLSMGLLLLIGCGREPVRQPAAPSVTPIRATAIAAVETDWPSVYEATGTVRAATSATVSSKLMGYTREVRAHLGERVRAGQILVVLDARDLESSVQRAEAGREEIRGSILEADSAITAARAQLDLAQVSAGRMQELLSKRSITNQEFDESSARLKAAQAALEMARAKRQQLDARMAQADQAIRTARIERGYAEITAPFSGTITSKSVEPGTLTVPGAPLYTIERDGVFRLEASVEESRLSLARVGKTIPVVLDGVSRTFNARIAEIVPSIDSSARTGTVKIDLPQVPELRSGLFGRARFESDPRRVLAIPANGVVERGQLQMVYIAQGNTARTRLVTLGARLQSQVEVLSGLSSGDRIIAPIPAGLADGTPIEVRP